MHGGVYATRGKLRDNGIAVAHIDHELVIDAFVARIVVWHLEARAFEQAAIFFGNFAAPLRPGVQAAKLDAQHGALKSLHAVVEAGKLVVITRGLTMGTRCAGEFRNGVVVGGERAALAVST